MRGLLQRRAARVIFVARTSWISLRLFVVASATDGAFDIRSSRALPVLHHQLEELGVELDGVQGILATRV